MLALLNRRARLVQAIGAAKSKTQAPIYAPDREKDVLARLVDGNRGPLTRAHVGAIFREVISASRSLEQRLRVAYLGPRATYTHLAALAQLGAAAYKLAILADGIQDDAGNTTRFLVLAGTDAPKPSGDDKTSLVVSVRDEVGVLAKLLRPFAQHGIDLIKIESRPLRERPWEYYFFLDLRGHRTERRVARALAAVARRALRAKVLGSYPAATPG